MENSPIVIVEYDPQWPILFEQEKKAICAVIGHFVKGIEHMGSTAVPGLPAKPLIDICIGLQNIDDAMQCIEPLKSLGYEYVSEYEKVLPNRRYFRKGQIGKRTHHLHMWQINSLGWKRHINFRNILRKDRQLAYDYFALKAKLAKKYVDNRPAYSDAKSEFIESVLRRAEANGNA